MVIVRRFDIMVLIYNKMTVVMAAFLFMLDLNIG